MAAPVPSHPLAPGATTSEGILAKWTVALGAVVAVLGTLTTTLQGAIPRPSRPARARRASGSRSRAWSSPPCPRSPTRSNARSSRFAALENPAVADLPEALPAGPVSAGSGVPPKTPAALFSCLALLFTLAMPVLAHAQTAPVGSPLTLQIGGVDSKWTFHPAATVGPLTGWDFSSKKWVTNVSVGAQVGFDWDQKLFLGGGGNLSIGTGSAPTTLSADLLVGGPTLVLYSGTAGIRPGLMYLITKAGGPTDQALLFTGTINF